ncbi:MAG: PspC domain-containing protein [Thiohalospira sp.]
MFSLKYKYNDISKKTYTIAEPGYAGVCAGIAEYFGWDIGLVRILYLLISIFSAAFPGIIVYIILWIVMPQENHFVY